VATVTNLQHLLLLLFLLHVQNLPPQAQSSPSAAAREKALHLSFSRQRQETPTANTA